MCAWLKDRNARVIRFNSPSSLVISQRAKPKIKILKSASGIGPRFSSLKKQLAQLKPPIQMDDLLQKETKAGQPVVWRVRPTAREVWEKFNANGTKGH